MGHEVSKPGGLPGDYALSRHTQVPLQNGSDENDYREVSASEFHTTRQYGNFYEIPANDFHVATDQDQRHSHVIPSNESGVARDFRGGQRYSTTAQYANFDFNDSSQPNPWIKHEFTQKSALYLEPQIKRRRFAECYDPDLFAYLNFRSVSIGFLVEIDQFLDAHPEIASCAAGQDALRMFYTLSPLQSYKCFIKGYARPARYLKGIIQAENISIPLDRLNHRLAERYDPELDAHINGHMYPYDILFTIDEEAKRGIKEVLAGRSVRLGLRKLICYALWGNPVDAYKWYQYQYQETNLSLCYLPEHLVLMEIPKADNYFSPRPDVTYGSKKYGYIRNSMARAHDEGIDVVDVLLTEFRKAKVRKGHRRHTIEQLVLEAKQRLDYERQYPSGADIVDLVMDGASRHYHDDENALSRVPSHVNGSATWNDNADVALIANRFNHESYDNTPRISQATFHRLQSNITQERASRRNDKRQRQAHRLQAAKASLCQVYLKEANELSTLTSASRMRELFLLRAKAERVYVYALVPYLRGTQRMDEKMAKALEKEFTRKKMKFNQTVPNNQRLLSMYPSELH